MLQGISEFPSDREAKIATSGNGGSDQIKTILAQQGNNPISVGSGATSSRFGESVEGDREDDDHPDDDLLDVGRHVHQHETVEQHADQNRADYRAEDRARPAEEARAADDDGGDDGQLIAGPATASAELSRADSTKAPSPAKKPMMT